MRVFCVLMLLILSPLAKANEQSWHILTEPFPPYFSPELPNHGWMHDLVVAALNEKSIDVKIEYVAWSRAIRLTANGGAVAVLGAYKTEQRQQKYFYSRAIGKADTGFFAKSSLALNQPLKVNELKNYVIAKGEEYVVADWVESHPDLSFTQTVDLVTSLYMLLRGRVDLVAGTKQVGEHWLRNHPKLSTQPKSSKIRFIEPAVASQLMYVAFGKKLPGNELRVKQFNDAMTDFVFSDKLIKLLARHSLPETDKQDIRKLLQEQFNKPSVSLNR